MISLDEVPIYQVSKSQKVSVSNISNQSQTFDSPTYIVRLVSDVDCFILIGQNPIALSDGTSLFLPSFSIEYFNLKNPGTDKIAVIQSSSGGNLYISEMI